VITRFRSTTLDHSSDTSSIGLSVLRDKRDRFIGVEEISLGPTDIIKEEFAEEGAIAYRDLSAVIHGSSSSVLHRMEVVETREGVTVMRPSEDVGSQLSSLAAALYAFVKANQRRIEVFGWDRTRWAGWRIATKGELRKVFPQ
jgi:hypothetical protein